MTDAAANRNILWDYSTLAQNYERRAPYAPDVVQSFLNATKLLADSAALDIGAGSGRLSSMLAAAGLTVTAVEPNAAMRAIGIEQTRGMAVSWIEAHGEATGLEPASFDLVSYGSSLNVLDPARALAEAARVLRSHGWMMCLWNHRDLADLLQRAVEQAIRSLLPDYTYGSRREEPTALIQASGQFGPVQHFQRHVLHQCSAADFVAGFRAHATLQRQAGTQFERVLDAIAVVVRGRAAVEVPFTTNVWFAQRA
jgi:ubiquinone/menaquinone biosynthesis C-methylase UbiE